MTVGTGISLRALLPVLREVAPNLRVKSSDPPAILLRMIVEATLEVMLFLVRAGAGLDLFEASILNSSSHYPDQRLRPILVIALAGVRNICDTLALQLELKVATGAAALSL